MGCFSDGCRIFETINVVEFTFLWIVALVFWFTLPILCDNHSFMTGIFAPRFASYFIRLYGHPVKWNDAKYVERWTFYHQHKLNAKLTTSRFSFATFNWYLSCQRTLAIRKENPLLLACCCEIHLFAWFLWWCVNSSSEHRTFSIVELWFFEVAFCKQLQFALNVVEKKGKITSILMLKRQTRCAINEITTHTTERKNLAWKHRHWCRSRNAHKIST